VKILGYQDADHFSDVLASADLLIALLEPDAANFSVPSKVLSYLSAGRPIIALVPEGNPAALDVLAAGGCVAPPTSAGAAHAAGWLAGIENDPAALQALGRRARVLAEERFDIVRIGDEFEQILFEAVGGDVTPLRRTAMSRHNMDNASEVDLDEAVS
jgi:glycosyltransferase involved in cell wall biosynthesis